MAERQLAVLEDVRKYTEIMDGERILQELVAEKQQKLQQNLTEFFCDETSLDFEVVLEAANAQLENVKDIEQKVAESNVRKVESAKDATFTDVYEASQVTFERIKERDVQRKREDQLHFDPAPRVHAELVSPGGKNYNTQPSNNTNYNTTPRYQNTTPNAAQPNQNQSNGKNVFENFDHFARSMQNAVYNAKGHYPQQAPKTEDGWGRFTKKSWWQKTKDWFKSPNFKTGVKVTAMLGLQLGMAVIGKKYEVEGMGQAAMFLGCMVGIFFLSRELNKEGIDARSFGF